MPQRLALIVENRAYRGLPLRQLPTAASGAVELARVLADPSVGNFDQVEHVVDMEREALRRAVRDLFHFRKPYDLLLFYFAGFVILDREGRFFLGSVDAQLDNLPGTSVAVDFLSQWMDRSFSRRQILLLDSLLVGQGSSNPGDLTDMASAFRGKGYWRVVISATAALSHVHRGGRWHGESDPKRLTSVLVEALENGAADVERNGVIGIGELYEHVRQRYRRRRWRPLPYRWTYAERDEFIIARNPRGFEPDRRFKWNLIFGAVMAPAATLVIGWSADHYSSAGLALTLLLMYLLLYRWLD